MDRAGKELKFRVGVVSQPRSTVNPRDPRPFVVQGFFERTNLETRLCPYSLGVSDRKVVD